MLTQIEHALTACRTEQGALKQRRQALLLAAVTTTKARAELAKVNARLREVAEQVVDLTDALAEARMAAVPSVLWQQAPALLLLHSLLRDLEAERERVIAQARKTRTEEDVSTAYFIHRQCLALLQELSALANDPRCAQAWRLMLFGVELFDRVEAVEREVHQVPFDAQKHWAGLVAQARGEAAAEKESH
jgi:hypothetical protein